MQKDDVIYRQAAIDVIFSEPLYEHGMKKRSAEEVVPAIFEKVKVLPSAQSERLTDDDFETIRIHLSAQKERLCNQHRWEEAEEYQRIIDRFMRFASVQQERKWIPLSEQSPEDGTWNIFTDGKNISVERYKMDALDHFWPNGRWFEFDEAIAWMPLPEPYHEDKQDNS